MFEYPSIYLELFFSMNKIMFLISIIYFYGFALGLISFIVLIKVYHLILSKLIIKAPMLKQPDRLFLGKSTEERISLIAVCDISDFCPAKIKERFLEALRQVPKVNCRLKYFLGNFFWKHVELTESRINELFEYIPTKIKDFKGAMEFAYKEANIPLDLSIQCLKCYIIPYTDNKLSESKDKSQGAIIFKVDHSFSDGLGILNYMLRLAENFSLEMLPNAKHNKKDIKNVVEKKPKGILYNIYNFLIRIPYMLFTNMLSIFMFYLKSLMEFIIFGWYFTLQLLFISSKNNIFDKTASQTGKVKFTLPLEYDLNSFKKIAKDHFKTKITLNELVISLLSATLKRLDKQSRDVAIFIPLGKTKIEDTFQKISDNNLNNNAVGAHIKLPLIDHLDSNSIKMMQKLLYSQIVSQKFIIQAVVNSVNALNSIIPLQFTKMLMKQATKDLDLLFSNLPGPQEPIFINGCKVERIVPFASTGVQKCFITLYSYNGKINLISNFDEGQNIDPEEFKRCFNEVFEETLNNKLTIIEN